MDKGYFFLMEWEDMIDGDLPIPSAFIPPVVAHHQSSLGKFPDGKFGASVSFWFCSLCLANGWADT